MDLHNKYSLSHVRSKDLDVAIVAAWLIAGRHHRLARLPYGKCAFQILLIVMLANRCDPSIDMGVVNYVLIFKRIVSCYFHDGCMRLKTHIYGTLLNMSRYSRLDGCIRKKTI